MAAKGDEEEGAEDLTGRIPSPVEFMRQRRPHLFSDSEVVSDVQIPRETLDFHLETLTSRKQEYEFEYFARLLAEKELCPNLLPQTGPTGGGDGGVDTETYPVADDIASRWFVGEANAARERWAFAISAKNDWKSKVKADVAAILRAGRGYRHIYFITSRYARSKDRMALENRLGASSGVPVTILDRTWILEKVYSNRRLDLAARALRLDGYNAERTKRAGPNDLARESELRALDAQTADPGRYTGSRYALVEDCLRSALLARGLEHTRSEVDSRFALTARFADEVGYNVQRLRVAYNRAWTAFWWHGDCVHYNSLYDQAEALALASFNASDLDLLFNLWQLLGPAIRSGGLSADTARLDERGTPLAEALERIATDLSRPNNALAARATRLLMQATQLPFARGAAAPDRVWAGLRDVVRESGRFGSYSIERLHDVLIELGRVVPESEALDALFDDLTTALERRRSEGEVGKVCVERGLQKLAKGLPYDAIRLLGRAETRLATEEYRSDLVVALLGISEAYRQAGLLWAARSKALVATERLLSRSMEHGPLDVRLLLPCRALLWLELQLGRVPHVLATIELIRAIVAHLGLTDEHCGKLADELMRSDAALGAILLNTSVDQLRELRTLPDALGRLGLQAARMALLWSLGHEGVIRSEDYLPPEEPLSALSDLMARWSTRPAGSDLPVSPVLLAGETVEMRSVVLGCEFVVTSANNTVSVCLAEALLAAIESFLATSLKERVMPYRERFDIAIRPGGVDSNPPQLRFEDDGGIAVAVINHSTCAPVGCVPALGAYAEWLRETLIAVVLKVLLISDPEAWLKRIAGDENGFSRAVALGNVAIVARNVYGENPKLDLTAWVEAGDACYELRRDGTPTTPISAGDAPAAAQSEPCVRPGSGSPPAGIFDIEAGKHSDRRVTSLIDVPLWDEARWGATAFASYGPDLPPCVAIGFRNIDAGKRIFEGWRAQIGSVDRAEELRIAIVAGVSRSNPDAYAVTISRDVESVLRTGDVQYLFMLSRINRMEAVDPRNLQRFLREYAATGTFLLAPAEFVPERSPRILADLGILKAKLVVRRAWEIDENDPDLAVLDAEDEPVIPEGIEGVPVLRALARVRASAHPK